MGKQNSPQEKGWIIEAMVSQVASSIGYH